MNISWANSETWQSIKNPLLIATNIQGNHDGTAYSKKDAHLTRLRLCALATALIISHPDNASACHKPKHCFEIALIQTVGNSINELEKKTQDEFFDGAQFAEAVINGGHHLGSKLDFKPFGISCANADKFSSADIEFDRTEVRVTRLSVNFESFDSWRDFIAKISYGDISLNTDRQGERPDIALGYLSEREYSWLAEELGSEALVPTLISSRDGEPTSPTDSLSIDSLAKENLFTDKQRTFILEALAEERGPSLTKDYVAGAEALLTIVELARRSCSRYPPTLIWGFRVVVAGSEE